MTTEKNLIQLKNMMYSQFRMNLPESDIHDISYKKMSLPMDEIKLVYAARLKIDKMFGTPMLYGLDELLNNLETKENDLTCTMHMFSSKKDNKTVIVFTNSDSSTAYGYLSNYSAPVV
jgi:hypothetical protein